MKKIYTLLATSKFSHAKCHGIFYIQLDDNLQVSEFGLHNFKFKGVKHLMDEAKLVSSPLMLVKGFFLS